MNNEERRVTKERRISEAIRTRDEYLEENTQFYRAIFRISLIGIVVMVALKISEHFDLGIANVSDFQQASFILFNIEALLTTYGLYLFPVLGIISGILLHLQVKQNEADFLTENEDGGNLLIERERRSTKNRRKE